MEQNNNQRNPSMRKQPGSQRAQTGTTEYQDKFIDPRSYKTLDLTEIDMHPYHPLAGTKYMPMTTLRTKYIRKRMKVPPKDRKPSSPETPDSSKI